VNTSESAPDFFALGQLLVRAHAKGELDEDDGTITVNLDTLADDLASRLEATTQVLRTIMATILLPDDLLEKSIAAVVASERIP
jgi:hypothetical protein